jgi:hypothetical protein
LPKVDPRLRQRRTGRGFDDLQGHAQRRAILPFGDVGAQKLRIEIEGTLDGLRGEDAGIGTRQQPRETLLGPRATRREART